MASNKKKENKVTISGQTNRKTWTQQAIHWHPDVKDLLDEMFTYDSISVAIQFLVLEHAGLVDLKSDTEFHSFEIDKIMRGRAKNTN